jgi:hypothetical protein
MSRRRRRLRLLALLPAVFATILSGSLRAAPAENSGLALGAGFERLSRTISWDDGGGLSKLTANLITLQGHIRLGERFGLSLEAGLSLPSFNGLVFRELPISVEYQAGAAEALALAAEIRGFLLRTADFEIEGVGRIVSSIGFQKTWPLEDFAVDGETRGRPVWLDGRAGISLAHMGLGTVRPYLLVAADFLRGTFRMDQTLGDLDGSEKKAVQGKAVLFTALGVFFEISPRWSVVAEAALLPYAGGIDSSLSLGIARVF